MRAVLSAIATGGGILPNYQREPLRVLYYNAEDDQDVLLESLRQKSLFVGFPSDQFYATVLDAYRNIIHGFIGRPRTA